MSLATSFPALYARTFVIGLAVAAPVGSMGVLCIQRTLERGARAGLATGLGVATADGIYAALAAFGVATLSSALVAWQVPLRLVGGAVLIALGLRAAFSKPACASNPGERPEVGPAASGSALYASAVGLTLTNPMTIIAFGAIFASAGLSAQPGPGTAAIATIGVASGSLTWWLVLVTGVALARRVVRPRLLAAVNLASGLLVTTFGLLAVGSVFLH